MIFSKFWHFYYRKSLKWPYLRADSFYFLDLILLPGLFKYKIRSLGPREQKSEKILENRIALPPPPQFTSSCCFWTRRSCPGPRRPAPWESWPCPGRTSPGGGPSGPPARRWGLPGRGCSTCWTFGPCSVPCFQIGKAGCYRPTWVEVFQF